MKEMKPMKDKEYHNEIIKTFNLCKDLKKRVNSKSVHTGVKTGINIRHKKSGRDRYCYFEFHLYDVRSNNSIWFDYFEYCICNYFIDSIETYERLLWKKIYIHSKMIEGILAN